MKGDSESRVRAALNEIALGGNTLVYKPPDDARNWKPADFMVWWRDGERHGTAMLEVKETPNKATFPLRELRPSQLAGMRQAARVRLPYWLVIWWPRAMMWTISDAAKVLAVVDRVDPENSLPYAWLCSVAGMDCTSRNLAPILRSVLLGEVD